MNFFDDDFKFDNSPLPNVGKGSQKKLQTKKSIKVEDELDDIFVQLLDKQKKKNSRKEMPSFTSLENIDKPFSPTKPQNSQPQKWESYDSIKLANVGNEKNYEPLRDRKTSKSIYDEKGSQDGRSFKSGATGKVHFAGDVLDFPKTQQNVHFQSVNDLPVGSMRSMMNPPLRKRAQSKAESDAGEDFLQTRRFPDQNFTSMAEIDNFNSIRPPLPKKDPSPPKIQNSFENLQKTTILPKIQTQEKIVYIKQENNVVKEQYEKELKMIKDSHQKQVLILKNQLQKQTRLVNDMRLKLLREFEEQKMKERRLSEQMFMKQKQKMKELYEWQIKRKCQGYQLEIQRFKKFNQISLQSQANENQWQRSNELQRQKLLVKQKDLETRIRKYEDKEKYMRQKQKIIEARESQFQKYRQRQQEKLTEQRKELYRIENECQVKKLNFRKQQQEQKINLSSELSKQQLMLSRQRQQLKVEQQQLEMNRKLFEKQKLEYEQFNSNIMKEYKRKLKQLEQQKFYCQQKQIELYKKIHTVQIVTGLKEQGKKFNNQTNIENLDKGYFNKIQGEKFNKIPMKTDESQIPIGHTFGPSHSPSPDKIKVQNPSMNLNVSNSNLREYLLKVNKDNKRMRPF